MLVYPRRMCEEGDKVFATVLGLFLASVGLGVSGSHDLGEIACEIACNLMMLFADMRYAPETQEMRQSARAINVWISHQWMAPQSISSPL